MALDHPQVVSSIIIAKLDLFGNKGELYCMVGYNFEATKFSFFLEKKSTLEEIIWGRETLITFSRIQFKTVGNQYYNQKGENVYDG